MVVYGIVGMDGGVSAIVGNLQWLISRFSRTDHSIFTGRLCSLLWDVDVDITDTFWFLWRQEGDKEDAVLFVGDVGDFSFRQVTGNFSSIQSSIQVIIGPPSCYSTSDITKLLIILGGSKTFKNVFSLRYYLFWYLDDAWLGVVLLSYFPNLCCLKQTQHRQRR